MSNRQPSVIDVVESFLLGLSCLIGADQFYILLSHTGISIKIQYYILISTIFCTFIATFIFDCNSDFCINGAHFFYLLLLGALVVFVKRAIRALLITSLVTVCIGMTLTYLIIQACTRYSWNRRSLQSFIFGLFSSRLLPSFVWYLIKKRYLEYQSQLYSVSLSLVTVRFTTCLLALLIKVGRKKFNFSNAQSKALIHSTNEYFLLSGDSIFIRFCKKVRICLFPFFVFCISVALYLTFPPTMLAKHFNYSPRFISSLSVMEMTFHLLGSCFGIAYPLSNTGNDANFYFITILLFILYAHSIAMFYYLGSSFSHYFTFLLVMLSGFSLGYLWSFTLHIVFNTTLTQTCLHKEYSSLHCCCDMFSSECYCRYSKMLQDMTELSFPIMNLFKCYRSGETRTYKYAREGRYAIIICHHDVDIAKFFSKLTCSTSDCSCLSLVGVFRLESVTTSACNSCQLSVRLEASKISIPDAVLCPNHVSSGSHSGADCSKSCFSIDCCSSCSIKTTTKFKCCKKCHKLCEKVCKPQRTCSKEECLSSGTSCPCPDAFAQATKIFFCYTNHGQNYFREISPFSTPEFDGDLKIQNEFYIRNMEISNCCHSDLQVDLHCTMKNNFFRLTQIEYKNKTLKPASLTLTTKRFEAQDKDKAKETKPAEANGHTHSQPQALASSPPSAPAKSDACCCSNSRFVKLTVKYKLPDHGQYVVDDALHQILKQELVCDVEDVCRCTDKCKANCACCKKGSGAGCCCCLICKLDVDPVSSFIKRIDTVRVKLVCTAFIILGMLSLALLFTVFSIRNKRIKPYIFDPALTYEKLLLKVNQYQLQSFSQVDRLLQMCLKYCYKKGAKKSEISHMYRLFSGVLPPSHCDLLQHQVKLLSADYLNSTNAAIKREALDWCYCSGFVFGYLAAIFQNVQTFFAYWEQLWQGEYSDYRRLMSPLINKIAHRSKFALSLLSEVRVTEQGINLINKTRLFTWNEMLDELKRYTDLYTEESKLIEDGLPLKFDLRLQHYVDRWDHRVNHIKYLISANRSIFDWTPFLFHYDNFKVWHGYFGKFIHRFGQIISIPIHELNMNTGVFAKYKI